MRREAAPVPSDVAWQWQYRGDQFVPNYLGHILHYIEGMIMEVRERPTLARVRPMSDEYLSSIGATRIVRERVELFRRRYQTLLPAVELTDIFISEIRDSDGLRLWQSLWLWGPEYAGEATNFLSDDKFDGTPLGHMRRWEFTLADFELDEPPTERSRASLEFSFNDGGGLFGGLSGKVSESSENCEYLVRFFRKVVAPRILNDHA